MDFDVVFKGVKNVEGKNYLSQMGLFEIKKGDKFIKTMKPEKRFYNSGKQMTTEAAISSNIFGDLYIALGDKNLSNKNETQWTTRIWYNPFTLWIWISVLFLSLAGIISFARFLKSIS